MVHDPRCCTAWSPEPARGCCGGSAVVACVGNPALSWEEACSLRTAVRYIQCVTHTGRAAA
eukprot:6626630-Prymnesium_polylepis.1